MKIITADAAYVQISDLTFLGNLNDENDLPSKINYVINNDSRISYNGNYFIGDNGSRHNFIKFEAPEEISYFMDAEWMIDYNAVRNLSKEEIIEYGKQLEDERKAVIRSFHSLSDDEMNERMKMVEMLDYKMFSLRDFYLFKQGTIEMYLPEGVRYPSNFGAKRRVKTFFNNRK